VDLEEYRRIMEKLGEGFEEFKKRHTDELTKEREHREALERKLNLAKVNGDPTAAIEKPEAWLDVKTRRPVPVLTHKMRLADLEQSKSDAPPISVGRMLRGIVLGSRAPDAKELRDEFKALAIVPDPAGGYTVPTALSAGWIDALRARMVLSQAGARTIPMDTRDLTIARVLTDAVVSWHGENAALANSDPTFGAVNLTAKTVVGLVRFSLELGQDSANIEQILQSTLTSATAQAIDSAGLNGVAVDAAAAPTGIMNLSGRNTVTSIGAPTTWDWVVDGMYELAVDIRPSGRKCASSRPASHRTTRL
jgi:HK97 family phage major capsid protein